MKNIIIVEDESIIALEIERFVKKMGYKVGKISSDAKGCIEYFKNNRVDLVLMDVYIKGETDGIECAAILKSMRDVPVIYISAFSDDDTLERAIRTNPSAYLTKPFNRNELKIAIKIAFGKSENSKRVGDIVFDKEFSFDSFTNELIVNSQVVHLTTKELKLLKLFIEKRNEIVTIFEIENEIWPDREPNENRRRSLVARLRAKLNYKFIKTVHSLGYKF